MAGSFPVGSGDSWPRSSLRFPPVRLRACARDRLQETRPSIHSDSRQWYPDGMAAADRVTPERRHFSSRLPRPLWIGLTRSSRTGRVDEINQAIPISTSRLIRREFSDDHWNADQCLLSGGLN